VTSLARVWAFAQRHCSVNWYDFESFRINGIYHREGGQGYIGLSNTISNRPTIIKCTLAEELGHHFTLHDGFFVMPCFSYADQCSLERCEKRAMRWAADYLIDDYEFIHVGQALAEQECLDEITALASIFDVTPMVAKAKMESLEARGML